jgi:peptide/nickel transport system ATP-binding protein
VMYAGQIVEQGTLSQIVRSAVHPYPRGLLASTVHGAKRGARLETIPGTPPSLDKPPVNCSFAPRCSFAQPRCVEAPPPNVEIAGNRVVRCIRAEAEAVAATA